MRRRAALAVLACTAAWLGPVAACDRGGERGGGKSHPRDPELRRVIERVLAMDDALADGAERAGSDCAAMARAFSEVIAAHEDVLGRTDIDADPALRIRFDQLVDEHGERRAAWATRFAKVIAPCAADPRVGAALAPLEDGDPLRVD